MSQQCGKGWSGRCAASVGKKCRCRCGGSNHGRKYDQTAAGERHARFRIETTDRDRVIIRDLGPWDEHPTVTNDAEYVVAQLSDMVGSRRLFYWDSAESLDELLIDRDGRFRGFAPGPIQNEAAYASSSSPPEQEPRIRPDWTGWPEARRFHPAPCASSAG
jgi:hypothetical protein